MKWIAIIFVLNYIQVFSQNLVPNPSFENIDSCALNVNSNYCSAHTINCYCSFWFDNFNCLSSTSNLMSNCSYFSYGVPNNIYGSSYANSGNNYASVALTGFYPENMSVEFGREHLSIKLEESLVRDSIYCVSFFTKTQTTIII